MVKCLEKNACDIHAIIKINDKINGYPEDNRLLIVLNLMTASKLKPEFPTFVSFAKNVLE
ncbi:hypothetical protein [Amphibacillus jilinensis]|uniref:hypothetical protein n=1 Tax=Amphibacillus jilinensis TaxID=1216008 RepID=UPI0003743D54|nr:hypothetical protein [Amphibacillus jilinensis]